MNELELKLLKTSLERKEFTLESKRLLKIQKSETTKSIGNKSNTNI